MVDDPAQQWYWNEKDGTLHNAANKDYFLQNDLGWVMVAKDKPAKKKSEDEDDDESKKASSEDGDDEDEAPKKKKKPKKGAKGHADDFPTGKRKWYYNAATGGIETDVMGIKAEVTIFGQPKNWAEVELSPVNK